MCVGHASHNRVHRTRLLRDPQASSKNHKITRRPQDRPIPTSLSQYDHLDAVWRCPSVTQRSIGKATTAPHLFLSYSAVVAQS